MDWERVKEALGRFGGIPLTLYLRKTGLPFFDSRRLYGAIDIFFRVSGQTEIHDCGPNWKIDGFESPINAGRLEMLIDAVRRDITPKPKGTTSDLANQLRALLQSSNGVCPPASASHKATGRFAGLDSVLQSGIRGTAAQSYDTLQSGNSSANECTAMIDFFDGFLAAVGAARSETMGDIVFIPVFEGKVDLAKIISPLRAWLRVPVPTCALAIALLTIEASLFAEGYQNALSAIVYNRPVVQADFAYSGVLSVARTALGRSSNNPVLSKQTVLTLQNVLRSTCIQAWGVAKSPEFIVDAVAISRWIIHPVVPKNLRALITSQERSWKTRIIQLFSTPGIVLEIFQMAHREKLAIDHEECRKFAKAVASGIFHARMSEAITGESDPKKKGEKARKAWYDEVTLLRSATRAPQFFRRALILIEQGRRANTWVGSAIADEDFNPKSLEEYYTQNDRHEFEAFRDLFRMYLIQQSGPQSRSGEEITADPLEADPIPNPNNDEEPIE